MSGSVVIWFDKLGIADAPVVGGKNASLGEMVRELSKSGVRVPRGFATTAVAFRDFIDSNNLAERIRSEIERYHERISSLAQAGAAIRALFLAGEFPHATADAIKAAYQELCALSGNRDLDVAVRSSATAEDLVDASFAGQQETLLNIRGESALLDACRRCYASLFTDRAISYREAKSFDHMQVALSVGVQQMVRSDRAGAGVIFTIDTETGFPNAIVISAVWGLGETVVQGAVDPDKYLVFKPLLRKTGLEPIIDKQAGAKAIKMIYATRGSRRVRTVETSPAERRSFVLNNDEIVMLARWAAMVEEHYGRPMDLEWAKDGNSGELYIVQARPETVQSSRAIDRFEVFHLKEKGTRLVSGSAIGTAIATGNVCLIRNVVDIAAFEDGAILVTERTDPDWVPIMKRAAGIVTDHGGATSHAAIVSRELGVPAIVGSSEATSVLREGQPVTLSCAEGERGSVYDGVLKFERQEVDLGILPETRTQLMVNLADPSAAFRWWRLPAKGVGLARMEFIINSLIKIHPMALVHPEQIDEKDNALIHALVGSHEDLPSYFVERLAQGIARLASTYYPHPAIVRLSDFKTNEYAHLIGGRAFEPIEENPMLGFRGASRYYNERYREGFALECRAIKRVREALGFANVIVMVPFCRTPGEADRVLEVMARNGLRRGENGLQIYMMCEIPSNVVLAREFAQRFDGFSIGSNDLTQLVLGVDRDSDILACEFDERNDAVKQMIADAIGKAHAQRIKVGICGQAPSNYPDYAAFLVACGIDSISLNPDSFVEAMKNVAAAEGASASNA